MDANTKRVFIVWTNTDLTEGRGVEYPLAYCELEATAKRRAKGAYVQGTDARVTVGEMVCVNGNWYAPYGLKLVDCGTPEDVAQEKELKKKKEAESRRWNIVKKARSLGLTDEEIKELMA